MKKTLRIFLALIFSFYFSFSHSETIPAVETEQWSASFGSGLYASDAAACQYMLNVFIAQGYQISLGGITVLSSTEHSCRWIDPQGNPAYGDSVYKHASVLECPSGYIKSGSTCTREDCAVGSVRLADGSCGRDCNALKNTDYLGYIPSSANPSLVCQEGCAAVVQNASNQASIDGQNVIAGSFSYSGSTCVGNNITSGTPPTCPSGQCIGTINGVNSCFTCSDIAQSASNYESVDDWHVKVTTSNSDGSSTSTVYTLSGDFNGDGTVSGSEVDSNGDGFADGVTPTSTNTNPSDVDSYCASNPTAITCLDTDSPDIPEPGLENIQSGASSFQTIKNLLTIQPSNFSHTSQCPVTSFPWNGQSFVVDAHCQLVNDHFTLLSAAMLAAWAVLSLFVVLRA